MPDASEPQAAPLPPDDGKREGAKPKQSSLVMISITPQPSQSVVSEYHKRLTKLMRENALQGKS